MEIDFSLISAGLNKKAFKYIGSGSGRRVYDIGNNMVVKVAKNKKGIAQNKEEYNISRLTNSKLFAKVIDASEFYRYVIMENAPKINDMTVVWEYFNVSGNKEMYELQEMKEIAEKYDLILKDLGRPQNWGRIGSRPVIVDYGFTRSVSRKYY